MKRIAISGYCGAGKTTAAGMLGKWGYLKVSEGSLLRTISKLLVDKTDRETLQTIGEGMRELLGQTVWLDAVLRNQGKSLIVIDDLRHPEDLAKLRELGFHTIWVYCPQFLRYDRLLKRDGEGVDLSRCEVPSEHLLDHIDDWDSVVFNTGTKEYLQAQLDLIVEGIRSETKGQNGQVPTDSRQQG